MTNNAILEEVTKVAILEGTIKENENSDRNYILVNAYLFSSSQVEKASEN